ncbi:MAG: Rha family transcriptional regulator, partial [Deltaproteobacteria bacterium]|nr:Rha family transcriptional regulator [Deltaproteobacteria bacterium]
MKKKTIVIYENEGRAGTFLIAKGFERRHEQVFRLIKKYQKDFEDFSTLKVSKVYGKGRPVNEYLLTEDQFLFLGTLFKNSSTVIEFKKKLIKEFAKTRKLLFAAKSQHKNSKWQFSRDFGKDKRKETTDNKRNLLSMPRPR